jgi:trans-aconitate 2-methyltransferase
LGDGAQLPFTEAFDAIFSTATFHWIPDHDQLFRSLHAALKPGGRVVAQCGGAGNLARLHARARSLMESHDYEPHFSAWRDFNHFENVPDTEDRLARAGFEDIHVSLIVSPVTFEGEERFSEFVAAVCLRHHLDRLPVADRAGFMRRVTDQAREDDPPLTLDYWRLNIWARKAAA